MTAFSGRLSDVDIRLLRIFSTIADCGGVSGAAFALNVDRSTISRQLTELETRLGLRLCERSRAGFWLTNEGRVILDRAQDLLGAINEFSQHDVKELDQIVAGLDNFVIKPSKGSGGKGILVIVGRDGDRFVKANGDTIALPEVRRHGYRKIDRNLKEIANDLGHRRDGKNRRSGRSIASQAWRPYSGSGP